MDTGTETGSDEEEDEDEDQMNVSGMRGVGKKKFLFCVSQSLRSGWCRGMCCSSIFIIISLFLVFFFV